MENRTKLNKNYKLAMEEISKMSNDELMNYMQDEDNNEIFEQIRESFKKRDKLDTREFLPAIPGFTANGCWIASIVSVCVGALPIALALFGVGAVLHAGALKLAFYLDKKMIEEKSNILYKIEYCDALKAEQARYAQGRFVDHIENQSAPEVVHEGSATPSLVPVNQVENFHI